MYASMLIIRANFCLVSVESLGIYRPEELLSEAIDILVKKCENLIAAIENLERK